MNYSIGLNWLRRIDRHVSTPLGQIREDSANARAMPKHDARFIRRSARVRLRSFPIATSKREAVRGTHVGFYRGQRIYLWCPFHYENTASCVWYPKGSRGRETWDLGSRDEMLALVNDLLILTTYAAPRDANRIAGIAYGILRMSIRRWWAERYPSGRESRTSNFHCYGCGKNGGEAELVRGLLSPYAPIRSSIAPENSEHWDGECPF